MFAASKPQILNLQRPTNSPFHSSRSRLLILFFFLLYLFIFILHFTDSLLVFHHIQYNRLMLRRRESETPRDDALSSSIGTVKARDDYRTAGNRFG